MAIYNNLFKAFVVVALLARTISAESFSNDVDLIGGKGEVQDNGNQLQLTLEQVGGSEAQSKQAYLFGRFDMQIKAVGGYSAGVVTSFFLQSPRPTNDEIDFELLGNVTGEPYILHTNVWTQGHGDREQQTYLWFDPTADFHTYTFIWNPHNIIFLVDGVPVRVFKNAQQQGILYPNNQPLHAYAALWDGDEWATRKGQVKIDWSKSPYVSYYRSYHADACISSDSGSSICSGNKGQWWDWTFDSTQAAKLKSVRDKYLVYDYCQDTYRFPQGFPPECSINM